MIGEFVLAIWKLSDRMNNLNPTLDNLLEAEARMNEDIEVNKSKTVYRLKEGIERFFIADINNPAGHDPPYVLQTFIF